MKGTRFEFRFRVLIIFVIYFFGFYAPWERFPAGGRVEPLWSWLAILIAHLGWMPTRDAYVVITLVAIALTVIGAWLRVWGTAYLGHAIMRDPLMHADQVVAAGPYRHVRNPLYMGNWFTAIATAILMPPTGALFFVVALTLFLRRLVGGEEAHLAAEQSGSYDAYRKLVPRFVPHIRSRVSASEAAPAWLSSVLAESYSIAIALCFAILAWRYDAILLIQCVLICFGASMVVHALMPRQPATEQA